MSGPLQTRYVGSASRWAELHASAAEDDVLELAGLAEVLGVQGDAVQDLVRPQLRHVERFGCLRTDDVATDERRHATEGHRDPVTGPLARDEQTVDRHGSAAVGELSAGSNILVAAQHTRALDVDDVRGVPALGVHRLRRLRGLGLRLVRERVAEDDAEADADRGYARDQQEDDPVAAGLAVVDAHARDFTILCNYLQYLSNTSEHDEALSATVAGGRTPDVMMRSAEIESI